MSDVDYWNIEPDGETSDEMEEERIRRNRQQEAIERREWVLWNRYAGYFGRDGEVVIRPRKRSRDY